MSSLYPLCWSSDSCAARDRPQCPGVLASLLRTLHYLTDRLRDRNSTANGEAPEVEVASDGIMSSCTGFAAAEDMLLMERLLGTPVDPPEP